MVAVSLKKKIFFKQKTAYAMCPCDWSSDVCSSDLLPQHFVDGGGSTNRQPDDVVGVGGGASATGVLLNTSGLDHDGVGEGSCKPSVLIPSLN